MRVYNNFLFKIGWKTTMALNGSLVVKKIGIFFNIWMQNKNHFGWPRIPGC